MLPQGLRGVDGHTVAICVRTRVLSLQTGQARPAHGQPSRRGSREGQAYCEAEPVAVQGTCRESGKDGDGWTSCEGAPRGGWGTQTSL